MTNYPTFCQQGAPAGKGRAEPRRFFRISPNRRPSCRKSDSNAQNMTVRGTSKMRKRRQRVACIAISQENPGSRISDNDACMLKPLPTYPEQEYFAHSGEKSDNMPREDSKSRRRGSLPTNQAMMARMNWDSFASNAASSSFVSKRSTIVPNAWFAALNPSTASPGSTQSCSLIT